jgi:hypothetical protein
MVALLLLVIINKRRSERFCGEGREPERETQAAIRQNETAPLGFGSTCRLRTPDAGRGSPRPPGPGASEGARRRRRLVTEKPMGFCRVLSGTPARGALDPWTLVVGTSSTLRHRSTSHDVLEECAQGARRHARGTSRQSSVCPSDHASIPFTVPF